MTTINKIHDFGFGVKDLQTSPTSGGLDKDAFMKLLVEQLKNQDPLDPMDNQAFVAQMAQFSSLEQQIGINQNLQTLQLAMLAQNNSQAAALVGKVVSARGDTFHYKGEPIDLSYNLGADADKVRITIKDKHGQVVKTIEKGNTPAGDNSVSWDGKNEQGLPLSPDDYSITVEAWDKDGNSINTTTYVKGKVSAVFFDKGYPELLIAGKRIKLGDVVGVAQDMSSEGSTNITI